LTSPALLSLRLLYFQFSCIAQIALKNGVFLLHRDKGFNKGSRVRALLQAGCFSRALRLAVKFKTIRFYLVKI
jgi:hypothetical protein